MPKQIALMRRLAAALALLALCLLGVVVTQPARAQSLTDYLETALINHIFRGTVLAAPGTVYVRLNTSACTDGSSGTEVSGGAYARVAVAATTAQWAAPAAGNGVTSNVNVITFPTPSASWGTVTHFEIMDAASAGNSLICQALTTSKTVGAGDTVSFPAGALTVTFN